MSGEPVAWRVPVYWTMPGGGKRRTSIYTEMLPYCPGEGYEQIGEPEPLYANPVKTAVLSSVMVDRNKIIARAICKSGKFETGEGTCALICMSQLGDARRDCSHVVKVHGKLAEQIEEALDHDAA